MSRLQRLPPITLANQNPPPIRMAVLGGPKSGKSSIISKLAHGNFNDAYYPTIRTNPVLINYYPTSPTARTLLDTDDCSHTLELATNNPSLVLSPVIHRSLKRAPPKSKRQLVNSTNPYYVSYFEEAKHNSPEYIPPQITPILVELIDTPAFDPLRVVPFLELSLDSNLSAKILHRRANEPRLAVSTNALLVASGTNELDGNIDAYFLTYSAVPSQNPPSYHETDSNTMRNTLQVFDLVENIKDALHEAWREYIAFKRRRQAKVSRLSLKLAITKIWQTSDDEHDGDAEDTSVQDSESHDIPTDPADPDNLPPLWILCTHSEHPFASPNLVQQGRQLATNWKCGFVAVDNAHDNVQILLAASIREIVERKRLQKQFKKRQN